MAEIISFFPSPNCNEYSLWAGRWQCLCPSHSNLSFYPIEKIREKILGQALHLSTRAVVLLSYTFTNTEAFSGLPPTLWSLLEVHGEVYEDHAHMRNFSLQLQLPGILETHASPKSVLNNLSEILFEFS